MDTPLLLRGVDLAAFAAAVVARLRGAGVAVSADGHAAFVQALHWAARLTLVNRMEDLGWLPITRGRDHCRFGSPAARAATSYRAT